MAISPQQLTIYLYSAHRAVIFAMAQLSCMSFAFIAVGYFVGSCAVTLIVSRRVCLCVGNFDAKYLGN